MSVFEIPVWKFEFVSLTFWSLILLGFSCVERLEIWICLRADPALLCFRLPDLVRQSELVVREPVGVLVCRVDTWVGILGRYMIGSLCLLSSFSFMGIVGLARYPSPSRWLLLPVLRSNARPTARSSYQLRSVNITVML